MLQGWVLVPWKYLKSNFLIGKVIRIYHKADAYLSSEGACTSIHGHNTTSCDVFIGLHEIDICEALYQDPDHYHMVYMLKKDLDKLELRVYTNKGQSKCVLCSCPTEKKRDFLTFEVREFCPRCRI